MSTTPAIRVLLLAKEFDSAHILREMARHAGLSVEVDQVASRDEFLSHIKNAPDLILLKLIGTQSLPLEAALERAGQEQPPVPVVVIGEELADSAGALKAIRNGAADYLVSNELKRLPLVIERLQRQRARYENGKKGAVASGLNTWEKQPAARPATMFHVEHEQKRTAKILRDNQKLITIGRLAGSIAHEINNPLESITNLLYLLGATPGMPDVAGQYLAMAQKELDRVVQISKQTLNFYRETPVVVRMQPADLLEEVLVLYGRRIEEKQIRVFREYDSSDAVSVFPGEIRQVFSNLITNAIEASTHGGKLRLRVRRARQWSDRGVVGLRVSVGDSGSGIPAEIRGRLGQPFFTTKGERGTGLGLWVTQSILERYGGHIQLCSSTSPDRHGTVFTIFLPTNLRPQSVPIDGGGGATAHAARVQVRALTGGKTATA